ncbi:MAG: hypothetical protein ACXW3C_03360 [Pyrinomonadaceae bacterium]
MRAQTVNIGKGPVLALTFISLLGSFVLSFPTSAQNPVGTTLQAKANEREPGKINEPGLPEDERRAFAISLVISVADEARSYSDLALRPRVLARSADALWNADNATARALFRRAWEAAEKGDAEDVTVKTKDNPPPMVIALRRSSGRDLRSEVLSLIARRDRALGEEFFTKLKKENEREKEDSKGERQFSDSWSTSEAVSKRLQVAGKLLDDGQVEPALEFAAPALDQVNPNSIGFLSALRAKSPEAADQRFALLLARAQFDPLSDANTVSGLSSYAFTPGFYVTFNADGGSRWRQGDSINVSAPNLPPALVKRFFEVASAILLRPLPPSDQDFTSSGQKGKRMVMLRLLPLFDQHAPDTAAALRAQLTALGGDPKTADNPLLTDGLQATETGGDSLEEMQSRIDQAKTSGERDSIYADAAVSLASQGDIRAKSVSDKIDDPALRAEVRRFVDFEFVQISIRKKDASEAARLAKTEQLAHSQRAWAYTQAARLLMSSERPRALELLEQATVEARRIDGNTADRTVVLIGVAAQFVTADRIRAWEMMGEVVKAANSTETFTGDNAQIFFPMNTNRAFKLTRIGGRDFSLSGVFKSLTQDDFYRSIDLAKSFKNSGPRATATLAIASAVLEK